MLELAGVSKCFGSVVALETTDISIRPACTTVLIGPSGCGKSTLLRLMIGLITPDSGCVRFGGTEITSDNVLGLRRRMGYVIQDGGLFPHLDARRNVTLMARYLGWSEPKIHTRLLELASLTRFPENALARFPVQLSGGQRQRVSLMRALMLDPQVLLLDEPLGALDPMIRAELQDELREIFEALGKTVVLVTHDLAEAGFFGHEIALMNTGRVLQKGSLQVLAQQPADPFVTRFIRAQEVRLEAFGGELS